MKKYKTRHFETLNGDLFPRMLPHPIFSGETSREREVTKINGPRMVQDPEPQRVYDQEPLLEHDPEPQQSTLDKVWEWLGNPEIE